MLFSDRLLGALGSLLIMVVFIATGISYAGVKAEARLEKNTVTIGEPFLLMIEVNKSAQEKVSPSSAADFPAPLEARDIWWQAEEKPKPASFFDKIRERWGRGVESSSDKTEHGYWMIKLVAWETGDIEIPAIAIRFRGASGKDEELKTNPLKIRVASVLNSTDAEKIKVPDIRKPANAPFPYMTVLLTILTLAVLALLIYFLSRYVKSRPRKEKPAPLPPPPLPPYEVALQRLKEIEAEQLLTRGLAKEYAFRLSLCLREYLELGFKIKSLESTTKEVEELLRSLSLTREIKDEVLSILRTCDLVMFARLQPSTREEDLPSRIRKIVEDTRSQPEPVPPVMNMGRKEAAA